ncbi:PrsW family intramembrane metalloprotease [Xylanibacter muris]|uniref:Protease PrsW n=1 Tax=Xylanibacter muris TaxID=2736290 RepID=A0ABX2AKR3_9BACT|nr:PrsW family intramembrane metalloprotease [Xylanibacter muris]NPD91468.1 PrsW family intramembrane metalloprotease [Xylanibacter muris]
MNDIVYLLIAALAPAVLLAWYIYRQDSLQAEPVGWLLKAVGMGVCSALLTLVIVPLYSSTHGSVFSMTDAFIVAFIDAALPEEGFKLLMLWLLLRRNPYFDEHLDGIVYAVCVGMGFAGFENIIYLIGNYDDWVGVGIVRALFSVPAHFFFAVLMGYFYSLAYFQEENKVRNVVLMFVAPVVAHGLFDACLFMLSVMPGVAVLFAVLFLIGFNRLKKRCTELIRIQKEKDIREGMICGNDDMGV